MPYSYYKLPCRSEKVLLWCILLCSSLLWKCSLPEEVRCDNGRRCCNANWPDRRGQAARCPGAVHVLRRAERTRGWANRLPEPLPQASRSCVADCRTPISSAVILLLNTHSVYRDNHSHISNTFLIPSIGKQSTFVSKTAQYYWVLWFWSQVWHRGL